MIGKFIGCRFLLASAVIAFVGVAASAQSAMEKSQPGHKGMDAEKAASESATRKFEGRMPMRDQRPSRADVFDDRDRVIPPAQLSKVRKSGGQALRSADIAQGMRTKSVTPDGIVRVEAIPPALAKNILEGINRIEKERAVRMPRTGGGDRDSPPNERSKSVIGTDERVQIGATDAFPFRAIGRLALGCTGTLVGPHHVLTAGHCVYNTDSNKWYKRVDFSPGQNGDQRPFGTVGWKKVLTVTGWTDKHDERFDYAMIILDRDIGEQLGWLGFAFHEPMPPYTININGYPGDKPEGTMWHAECEIVEVKGEKIYYPCDTAGGMSGSSVYVYDKKKESRTIYGVHAYGASDRNSGTRIDQAKYEIILNWKSNN